ncbi:aldose 1-epimerase [Novosphingobium sp. 1949]|uniref:Aldose 1-epimerase n=1 Tax=Novosphingobium organovorum TaxID=2930092 RepID=A0ABT0BDD3_9SPHN|nr:aldose 1-epimerase [Novosphingobium organovorum]MCJ2182821.1 aldose 1-epimerase [Novosphingobium organovorum]
MTAVAVDGNAQAIAITAGEWTLRVDPRHGGMVRALTRRGADVLRPMPEASTEPLESACFPLAPYVNRIAHGLFTWEGESHALAPNHPAIAHPLHGTAWLETWDLAEHREDALTLTHAHRADARWGWSFTARQTFTLTANGLHARLALTNTDTRTMPAGIGFHPWFARRGVEAIAFAAQGVWLGDEAMLPTRPAPADQLGDWSAPASLDRPALIDNCYFGWDGTLRIERKDGAILLESAGTRFLHLFVPPGGDFFCAEPQTTMPDALNRPTRDQPGTRALAPGESLTLDMTIRSA